MSLFSCTFRFGLHPNQLSGTMCQSNCLLVIGEKSMELIISSIESFNKNMKQFHSVVYPNPSSRLRIIGKKSMESINRIQSSSNRGPKKFSLCLNSKSMREKREGGKGQNTVVRKDPKSWQGGPFSPLYIALPTLPFLSYTFRYQA